ncbi:MAG TPA: Uma2 family endonuclease [Pyrinomonadaceae bacterium]|nr:Uma2 family endonuclease [Pyrinomonadaceae bacterium]
MSRQTKNRYVTPEEYLAFERAAEYKNEYFGGEIIAMTGASRRHNLIAGNIFTALNNQLRAKPCEAYISDMRVRIPTANIYTYPDVVVACGQPEFEDAEVDTLLNPVLIVEVLSKSTASYDRLAKFGYYRTLPSLVEYILVAQNERHIAQHTKQADGRWILADVRETEARVELSSVECVLAFSDVYDKVEI